MLLAFAISSPALAAEFYVAKDATTQVCEITEEKPDGTKLVMVGTEAYTTKDEAKLRGRRPRGQANAKRPTSRQARADNRPA